MSAENTLVYPAKWDAIRGATGSEAVDVTAADFTATKVVRGIQCDADTTVKMDFIDSSTDTLLLAAKTLYPYEIKKIYQAGTSPTTGIHVFY